MSNGIVCCNRGAPIQIELPRDPKRHGCDAKKTLTVVVRGRRNEFEVVTAPTIKGYVLTPLSFEVWRTFVREHSDHPALIQGDLFAAADLNFAIAQCRVAPPRSQHPGVFFELELGEMRMAAE